MARPKSFDQDQALLAAAAVFADHGFEGTSTEILLARMGISRQSLYDTFGDKRRLYLDALERYNADSVNTIAASLNGAEALQGIEDALYAFAARSGADGCLGVGSICEFGRSDPDVNTRNEAAGRVQHSAFARRLEEARAAGLVAADLDIDAAIGFLGVTLAGMKVAARGGASTNVLRDTARLAIRALR